MKFPYISITEANVTKERILLVAVQQFAIKGFGAVSVRDIAEEVGIKSASLYNHFESKDAILDEVIEIIINEYHNFYMRIDEVMEKATCFADVLDILFGEVKNIHHMFIHYGLVVLSREQYWNDAAYNAFNNIFMCEGIDYSDRLFRHCIEAKWVAPFDTKTLATIVTSTIYTASPVWVAIDLEKKTIYNPTEMFTSIQRFVYDHVTVLK